MLRAGKRLSLPSGGIFMAFPIPDLRQDDADLMAAFAGVNRLNSNNLNNARQNDNQQMLSMSQLLRAMNGQYALPDFMRDPTGQGFQRYAALNDYTFDQTSDRNKQDLDNQIRALQAQTQAQAILGREGYANQSALNREGYDQQTGMQQDRYTGDQALLRDRYQGDLGLQDARYEDELTRLGTQLAGGQNLQRDRGAIDLAMQDNRYAGEQGLLRDRGTIDQSLLRDKYTGEGSLLNTRLGGASSILGALFGGGGGGSSGSISTDYGAGVNFGGGGSSGGSAASSANPPKYQPPQFSGGASGGMEFGDALPRTSTPNYSQQVSSSQYLPPVDPFNFNPKANDKANPIFGDAKPIFQPREAPESLHETPNMDFQQPRISTAFNHSFPQRKPMQPRPRQFPVGGVR
jgi:hypothetical protein